MIGLQTGGATTSLSDYFTKRYEMASSEKQMISLENIPQPNEGILDPDIKLSTSSTDLVETTLPSRRRKVVIIVVVIVVIIVIAVAAFLIVKYVSASKDNSKRKWSVMLF